MAVDKIDPQLQSIISDAQLRSQKTANKDDQADAARKAAEKRQAEKKRELESERNKESFVRSPEKSPKASKLIQPNRSAQATSALNAWKAVTDRSAFSLSPSQSKVIESQVVEDPQRSRDAATAFTELSAKPTFEKAVSSRDQMFNLQRALLEKPQVAPAAEKVLDSKFMQSDQADNRTKTSFLKMSLSQAAKGGTDLSVGGLKHAAKMMGTLVDSGIGAMGQRSALSMVERRPTDTKAMDSVTTFSASKSIQSQTPSVKTKAAALLAKANGSESVAKGFQDLVSTPAFKEQTTSNQARMFSTIGSAKVQDYRAMTDVTLNAIRSPELGQNSTEVSNWLKAAASKVASDGIDAAKALPNRPMRSGGMPQPPKMIDMRGLDGDELQQARAQNRARIIQFYTGVQRHLDKQEQGIEGAKFAEDIHSFTQNLKAPVNLDLSALTPEEHAFAMERRESVMKKFEEVRKLHRQRSRELRGKRRPTADRIAPEQKTVASPRYFTIEGGRHNVASLLAKSSAPATLGLETPDWLGDVVRQALEPQTGAGLNQAGIEEVAKAVATKVASEVVESLTQALSPTGARDVVERDSMGIPKSRGSELDAPKAAIRPKQGASAVKAKPALQVRSSGEIFESNWRGLSRAESAMLRNLGWDQASWDNKLSTQAKWPTPMFTPFAALTPIQREAVEKLGFTVDAWNKRVEAFTSGRNA